MENPPAPQRSAVDRSDSVRGSLWNGFRVDGEWQRQRVCQGKPGCGTIEAGMLLSKVLHYPFRAGLIGDRITHLARRRRQRVDLCPPPGNDPWGSQGCMFLTLRVAPLSYNVHPSRQTYWLTKLAAPAWQTLDSSRSSQTLQISFPQARAHKVAHPDG